MKTEADSLYHGSPRLINGGVIKPHRGRNPDRRKDGNLFGIYATPDYNTAVIYSIGVTRTSLRGGKVLDIEYSPSCTRVCFHNCRWARKKGYVYKVSSRSFRALNDYEHVSLEAVPILETITIDPKMIDEMVSKGVLVLDQPKQPRSFLFKAILFLADGLVRIASFLSHYYYIVKSIIVR